MHASYWTMQPPIIIIIINYYRTFLLLLLLLLGLVVVLSRLLNKCLHLLIITISLPANHGPLPSHPRPAHHYLSILGIATLARPPWSPAAHHTCPLVPIPLTLLPPHHSSSICSDLFCTWQCNGECSSRSYTPVNSFH